MAVSGERQALREFGEGHGWNTREADRADVYTRDKHRIRVIWQGDQAISGASFFDDEMYEMYTRELDKVRAWLTR
ncbi:hypothetical protein [Mycobacterium sp. M26]|uniref:hypothetical protein n=1 Tax=Mycobacterium sp. M26 TaxID=1762962 RepID=UPI00073FA44E|nr:hypothetical protein [Mycobacterium sp. M26]